jgi:pyruvate ferredoxin oxidoreductase gamma subunit
MRKRKNMETINISIYGRGGQGAKTCAQIIAEAGVKAGRFVQAFPEYGPERRGAPVKAFVRISDKPIRTHEPILKPDVVMVIDGNLANILTEIKEYSSPLIINGNAEIKGFKSKEIFVVDGTKISLEEIKINNPNIVLIGNLLKFLENKKINFIKYKDVEEVIKETFIKKRKEHFIIPNLNCLKRGYDFKN